MNAGEVKQRTRAWVVANLSHWPGLRAAHLVGSITTAQDDAPWPAFKDVDLHLIFAEGSPALRPTGPFPTMIEECHDGLLIEAGIKSDLEYRSPEAVLANPEIAHHLTVECALYDPEGLLRDLQAGVRRDYAMRPWVEARLRAEREGLAGALAMRPMARGMAGVSGEAQILGYTSTFVAAALCVATLSAPTTGSRALLRVREILARRGRDDLYGRLIGVFGLDRVGPAEVAAFLDEGAGAFDLAVAVRRTPHPFQHKLHAHLRPYFVESCATLLAEGYHAEALHWLTPFYHASTDVILADGPEAEKTAYRERHARFLAALGLDTAEGTSAAFERAEQLFPEIFTVAEELIAGGAREK